MSRPAELASASSESDVHATPSQIQPAQIQIEPVEGRSALDTFIRLPNRL
jgi:hypothetical protein